MVGILDYGTGNVAALANIYREHRVPHLVSGDPRELARADRYVLPGVGAFDRARARLEQAGLVRFLTHEIADRGKRLLGICVGMQLLAESSDEGKLPGLGFVSGRVVRIDTSTLAAPPHLPHMGWNSIRLTKSAWLFEGIDTSLGFYFLHSYFLDATDYSTVTALVSHGAEMPCAVEAGAVCGVQFHPEKSHSNGARILLNFATKK